MRWQFLAGAYDRALSNRQIIVGEINRIWSKTVDDGKYRTDLRRLYAFFDHELLLNLKTGAPLSSSYRNKILKYAYSIYGRDHIAEIVRARSEILSAPAAAQIGKRVSVEIAQVKKLKVTDSAEKEHDTTSMYDRAKSVLLDTRYPDEPRVICIPVSEKICPIDTVRNKVQQIWKGLRPALGEKGFRNITLLFYDGTVKNLNEKLSGLAASGRTFAKANTLAYIDASAAEREPEEYRALADMKAKDRITMVREAIPQEGTYISVGGHVILALGILDIVRNGRSDPDYISLVANLAAAMSDGQPGTKAEDYKELLKKGDIAGIILRLPPARKIDINADMESHFLMEETAMKSL
jgi:hypothetical protein